MAKKDPGPSDGKGRKPNAGQSNGTGRNTTLSQMKRPLAFFGLALLVVEGPFGIGLARSSNPSVTITIAITMAAMFVFTVGAVALLL